MHVAMFMFVMHDIVVLRTCYGDVHGISLYDVVLQYELCRSYGLYDEDLA